jgi:hypothetical protein
MKKKKSTAEHTEKMSAKDFEEKFEKGEDLTQYLDMDHAVRRVNVDFPAWAIEALDHESDRVGITRQALIKFWVVEKLDSLRVSLREKNRNSAV